MKIEFAILGILILILLGGVICAGRYARQEKRDGRVREDLRKVKHQLEMYFNEHGQYPFEWDSGEYEYVVVGDNGEQAEGWYVGGKLENKTEPKAGFDEEYNIEWRTTEEGNYEICGGDYRCQSQGNRIELQLFQPE